MHFVGADQSKYGSLTKKFVTDFSLGTDSYPKTLEKVLDVLSTHRQVGQKILSQQAGRKPRSALSKSKPLVKTLVLGGMRQVLPRRVISILAMYVEKKVISLHIVH